MSLLGAQLRLTGILNKISLTWEKPHDEQQAWIWIKVKEKYISRNTFMRKLESSSERRNSLFASVHLH